MLGHTIHLSFTHKMEGMEGIHLNFFECLSDYSLILPNAWSFLGFYLPLSSPSIHFPAHSASQSPSHVWQRTLLSIFSIPFAPLIFYFFLLLFINQLLIHPPLNILISAKKAFQR